MGGFGALKLGVNGPEQFSAVASLSGLTDPLWAYQNGDKADDGVVWLNIFGDEDEMRGSVNDIHYKMEELIASGKPRPRFYQTCGTDDFLYNTNVAFRDRFKDRIDLTWHEEAGAHEWDYWDRNIKRVINWLPLAANKEAK
jgi:S-formylglutathione hydrolase FrmB